MISISIVERETGLSKDTLRKWETRYGFPQPGRNPNGERHYTQADLDRLLTIKRILASGLRPSHVVPLAPAELEALVAQCCLAEVTPADSALLGEVWQALQDYAPASLRNTLGRAVLTHGLDKFVLDKMPKLNQMVGDAWVKGSLAVHQEHLYSETIRTLLLVSMDHLQPLPDKPRVLLATPTGEKHDLGIMMVHAILALSGAHCISLGTETPATELIAAGIRHRVQVVAISFSVGFPNRRIWPFLEQVRAGLPEHIEIWAGGAGVDRLSRHLPGIRTFAGIELAALALSNLPAAG